MFRCHAFNKEIARPECKRDCARDTLLRRRQKCLDVLAHEIELFAFMNEIAVDRRKTVLDPYLLRAEHQFLEFAMRRDQGDRAGASNATRPLVPSTVSPRCMPRPMP